MHAYVYVYVDVCVYVQHVYLPTLQGSPGVLAQILHEDARVPQKLESYETVINRNLSEGSQQQHPEPAPSGPSTPPDPKLPMSNQLALRALPSQTQTLYLGWRTAHSGQRKP